MILLRVGTAVLVSSVSVAAQAAVFVVGDDAIGFYEPVNTKPPCSDFKKQEIFANATASAPSVRLDCSLDMGNVPPITKTLVIEGNAGSNVVVDCHWNLLVPSQSGVALQIASKQNGSTWEVPHHVTVRNCEVNGRVVITGTNDANAASRSMGTDYTAYSQRNAPHHIVLDTLVVTTDDISLYFYSGVTYSTIKNSTFYGNHSKPTIYLDAESAHNVVENNRFLAVNSGREVLSIDGSAYNRIVGNYFEGLNTGGIYIYRNCGEKPQSPAGAPGTIRVQEPRHNQIINNVFYYNQYTGDKPAVWVGSRDWTSDNDSFCKDDAGFSYGSSINNRDFAYDNVVAQNRFYQYSPGIAVKNRYAYGAFRNEGPVQSKDPRPSGCYVETKAGQKGFVFSGESVAVLTDATRGNRYVCDNGLLWKSALLNVTIVPFQCTASANNNGCTTKPTCPDSSVKVAARAVCNLELPNLENISAVGANTLSVARASDNVAAGICLLTDDTTTVVIQRGSANVTRLTGGLGFYLKGTCREYDENGGDCTIRGELTCL